MPWPRTFGISFQPSEWEPTYPPRLFPPFSVQRQGVAMRPKYVAGNVGSLPLGVFVEAYPLRIPFRAPCPIPWKPGAPNPSHALHSLRQLSDCAGLDPASRLFSLLPQSDQNQPCEAFAVLGIEGKPEKTRPILRVSGSLRFKQRQRWLWHCNSPFLTKTQGHAMQTPSAVKRKAMHQSFGGAGFNTCAFGLSHQQSPALSRSI